MLRRALQPLVVLSLPGSDQAAPVRHSRYDGAFLATGVAVLALVALAGVGGIADFEPYPRLALDDGPATVGFALALPALAAVPFALAALRSRTAAPRPLRSRPEAARC